MKISELLESSHTELQKFMITMWGRYLFLSYAYLPKSGGDLAELQNLIVKYDEASKTMPHLKLAIFAEEICNSPALSKSIVDEILHSCETTTMSDLVLYRAGTLHKDGWSSFSDSMIDKPFFYDEAGPLNKITLSKGSKIISTNGLADKHEVIVHNDNLADAKIDFVKDLDMDEY